MSFIFAAESGYLPLSSYIFKYMIISFLNLFFLYF